MSAGKVDVLAVMDAAQHKLNANRSGEEFARDLTEARAAVAELIEATRQEHGGTRHDPECPICVALARIGGAP